MPKVYMLGMTTVDMKDGQWVGSAVEKLVPLMAALMVVVEAAELVALWDGDGAAGLAVGTVPMMVAAKELAMAAGWVGELEHAMVGSMASL